MAKKPGICNFFQAHGTCPYGRKCKYSHDTPPNTGAGSAGNGKSSQGGPRGQPSAPTSGQHRIGAAFSGWKRVLKQETPWVELTLPTVTLFIQQGLGLMNGDADAFQEVIRELATDQGLAFIKNALDWQVVKATADKPTQAKILTNLLVPLFRWITHPRVLSSALLEQQVVIIFSFIRGSNGARMTKMFNLVMTCLESWAAMNITEPTRAELIELSLGVLSQILDCNTGNIDENGPGTLANKFRTLLESEPDSRANYSCLQARKYLSYIQARLGEGEETAAQKDRPSEPLLREQFVLGRDLPGELSAEGRRHDNDHSDITKIKIMPTAEEIMSTRDEYLPTTNSKEWHLPGIKGRLDREFRLLREDAVGQLRDTVRDLLETMKDPRHQAPKKSFNSARTHVYSSPAVKDVLFDMLSGMEIVVQFEQPSSVRRTTLNRRQDWWKQSKRLQEGALVCVLDQTGSILFFEVTDLTVRTGNDTPRRWQRSKNGKETEKRQDDKKRPSLADDENYSYVVLRLVDSSRHNITQTLRWYRNIGFSPRRYLVEFPGLLLAAFKHTLEALQEISKQPKIPFVDLIAPSDKTVDEPHINLPRYASQPGFSYDLRCISTDKKALSISAQKIRQESALNLISSRTVLDPTQSGAFRDALSRQLALIQGPPGTGKSFTGEKIIKTLIGVQEKAELGPVICVCYTNHALDQLLEHLLDAGIDGIIRMGSQSKSERIQELNLRSVVMGVRRTKAEKSTLYDLAVSMKDQVRQAMGILRKLAQSNSWQSIKAYLHENHRLHHAELFGLLDADEQGWQSVVHDPNRLVENWLSQGSREQRASRPVEILKTAKLSDLNNNERRNLHHEWLRAIRDPLVSVIANIARDLASKRTQQDRVRNEVDLRCLQEAKIIGLTTTGLARNIDLLSRLRCKVLVCEEAGEVLEAHLLTALLPSIEHAILIGDHLQLRPQIQNYDLQSTNPRGVKYSLDLSLFERLVKPPHAEESCLPFSVLLTQRRMHPSISELIRSTLYRDLEDGGSVASYPEVVGMKKRLFWFHHDNLEAGAEVEDPGSTSHSNTFEVEMTVALVSHLVRQGEYGPDDIAVLTPYLGQLMKLRSCMETMFEISIGERDLEDIEASGQPLATDKTPSHLANGPKPVVKQTLLQSLRVATVDNFQGEEAKVIVVSLVRSNPQNKCGFLNTSNRINVLLSRAKHGMYIIGNANTYSAVPMWSSVIDILKADGNFGRELELQCPRHPETQIVVRKPDDFLIYAPESGCNEPCDKRLDCGHTCRGMCHADVLHNAYMCLEKCLRLKDGCTHPCPLPCGRICHEKCQTVLTNINLRLPCGHIISRARCWEVQDPSSIACREIVTKNFPNCSHSIEVPCSVDITAANLHCKAVCEEVQKCGHACKSECNRCRVERGEVIQLNHGICRQICGRKYNKCPHSCTQNCHRDTSCLPCQAPCEVRCSHARCSKKCCEPCVPCTEAGCASGCGHSQCTMPCAAPCDFLPCTKRCPLPLSCGHQCPSICGERCPEANYCQTCASESIKSTIVDSLEMKEYRIIDLDVDPCVFPNCGHFMVTSSMDKSMDMSAHYEIDATTSHPNAVKRSSVPFSLGGVQGCAICGGSLRNIGRYGRIVRRAMLDEAIKKFITWSGGKYLALASRLLTVQEDLEKNTSAAPSAPCDSQRAATVTVVLEPGRSATNLIQTLSKAAGKERYKSLAKLWNDIKSFDMEIRREEKPFQQVAEMVTIANQQHKKQGDSVFDEPVVHLKGSVLALALLLKCEITALSDFCELRKGGKLTGQCTELKLNLEPLLKACLDLVSMSQHSKLPRHEAEGHIYYAQLCGFVCMLDTEPETGTLPVQTGNDPTDSPSHTSKTEELKAEGLAHTEEASRIMAEHPSLSDMSGLIEPAQNMLRDGVLSRTVSAEKLRAAYAAMATALRGTGQWYICENGHPFTAGEAAVMPVQQVRCPECDAPIGAQNRTPTAGDRRAAEMDALETGIERMQV